MTVTEEKQESRARAAAKGCQRGTGEKESGKARKISSATEAGISPVQKKRPENHPKAKRVRM